MEQRRRARILLVLLVFTALVLVTVDFRTGDQGPIDRLRGLTTSVLRPIQDGVVTLVRPVRDGIGGLGELRSIRADNRALRARVAELEERRRSVADLERENTELRRLLAVRDAADQPMITARVVALAPSTFEWTITLDVGTADGVRRGMPVIDSAGLVGRVVQAGARSSRVLLAIDPNFSAAARLAGNAEIGPIEGRGGDPMVFRPLDPEVEVAVGDEIVTSAYQGGLFPAGLPIGTVSEVGDARVTGLRREVQVQPFVDFTRLHHVLVVVHDPPEDLPPLTTTPDTPFVPPDVPPFLVPGDPEPLAPDGTTPPGSSDGEAGDDADGEAGDGAGEEASALLGRRLGAEVRGPVVRAAPP